MWLPIYPIDLGQGSVLVVEDFGVKVGPPIRTDDKDMGGKSLEFVKTVVNVGSVSV